MPDAAPSDLTLAQKVSLLSGRTFWRLPAEPAVGLRELVMSDGPVGVRGEEWDERDTSLTIPSPTSLAASWDPALVRELGLLLGAEARRKHVDMLLAPTVNLHRSPLAGRHFECYSEDPLLTAAIGVAFCQGVQAQGVAATVKHFVANDAETERRTVDNRVEERALREVYLAPFEAIVDAGVWAVMSAYNGVNGHPMTENSLLEDPLKNEWGFDGVVVSDWFAVYDTVRSARAALDLEMPGPAKFWGDALVAAVAEQDVAEAAVDAKLRRLLRLAGRVGALAGTSPSPHSPPADPRGLIRRAGAAGTVLVRNDGVLPLEAGPLHRVAILGPSAATARIQGGGSAGVYPADVVSPLEGMTAALGESCDVLHTPGVFVSDTPEPLTVALATDPTNNEPGIAVRILAADGTVLREEHRLSGRLLWLGDLDLVPAAMVEVRARVTADVGGEWRFAVGGVGRYSLELDGVGVVDEEIELEAVDPAAALFEPQHRHATMTLTAGQTVAVVATHSVAQGAEDHIAISVAIRRPRRTPDEEMAAAVALAAESDVAIVVVGTSNADESEGFDRTTLALPGRQDELIHRVAAVNPRTVVVVNSGSPVLLPWREEVGAVVLVWFPGQEAGDALADVLLGYVEPGGRLPTTWPARQQDVPVLSTTPKAGRLIYLEGIHIGYRAWLRSGAEPAYWFGHGLGYTTWTLAALTTADRRVRVDLRNTGDRRGRQVVQVYLSRPVSEVERPERWLAGFIGVELDAGVSQSLEIEIPERAFEHWQAGWVTEPGRFTVEVGYSVADLPLLATIER